jgi:acid phosphatase type 7
MTPRFAALVCLLLVACAGPLPDDDDVADDDDLADDDDDAVDDDDATADDDDGADDDDSAPPPDFSLLDPYVPPAVHVSPPDALPGELVTLHYTGELDDGERLIAHYGFDGWNLAHESLEPETASGDLSWFAEAEMSRVGDGFEVELTVPETARAMHVAFNDPDEDVWDNNDGDDHHWAFGGPHMGPWLTWNEQTEPATGVVVNWQSSAPCLGVVEYGLTEALGGWALGEQVDTVHHVVLTGLEPDAVVHYRVRGSTGVQGDLRSFRTAGLEPGSFSFVVLGDMQDNGEDQRWSEVAAAVLAEQPDAAFLVITGDMPADDKPGHWWTFFDKGRELFAGHVMMPAVGNHDTPTTSSNEDTSRFERWFELPGEETWYSFDYGDARFVALSSESGTFAPGETQYLFMEAALADAPGPVFASWHKPPYNAGSRHGAEQQQTRPITALFDGVVDWVLTGHEHFYQRMAPIRFEAEAAPSGLYGRGEQDGVGYLVMPPAGNNPSGSLISATSSHGDARPLLAWPEISEEDQGAPSELGFVVFEVGPEEIEVDAWAMGNLETVSEPRIIDVVGVSR